MNKKNVEDFISLTASSFDYYNKGEFKEATRASQAAYKLAPTNPMVMWDYGRALYMTGRPKDALRILKNVLKKRTEVIAKDMNWANIKVEDFLDSTRFEIAQCYLHLNQINPAIEQLEKCLATREKKVKYYYSDFHVKKLLSRLQSLKQAMDSKDPKLWISLLEVERKKPDKRIKYKRGFTNGIVISVTQEQALMKMKQALDEIGYKLVKTIDLEELELRLLKCEIDDELKKIASMVRKTGKPKFGTFHMYKGAWGNLGTPY